MVNADCIEVVAFTTPDILFPLAKYEGADKNKILRYERIVALWHKDGIFGQHVGAKTGDFAERKIEMPLLAGERLFDAFDSSIHGRPFNCHRFGRLMSGMPDSNTEPILNFEDLEPAIELTAGAVGIIGAYGWGVPHTIAYGLGSEGIQVMSGFGEFGIANNSNVLDFYRNEHPGREVNLYEL